MRSLSKYYKRANTGVVDVLFLVLKSYECTAHQMFRGKTDHGRIIERNKVFVFWFWLHTLRETNKMSNSPACRRILITIIVKYLFIYTGINARLYESLSFYIFRSVKINFFQVTTDFSGALRDVLASLYHLIILFTYEPLTNFSGDSPARCCRHGKDPIPVYGGNVIKPSCYR